MGIWNGIACSQKSDPTKDYLAKAKLHEQTGEYQQALEYYAALALAGNAEAQFRLAEMYRDGIAVEKNFIAAERWYAAAAEQGHVAAKSELELTKKLTTPENVQITRAEVDAAVADLPTLFTQIRVVPFFKDGKGAGFKVLTVKAGSLFAKLGFRRGDVVKEVDGQVLDIRNAMTIFTTLHDAHAKSFKVLLERRGKTFTNLITIAD